MRQSPQDVGEMGQARLNEIDVCAFGQLHLQLLNDWRDGLKAIAAAGTLELMQESGKRRTIRSGNSRIQGGYALGQRRDELIEQLLPLFVCSKSGVNRLHRNTGLFEALISWTAILAS